MEPEVLIGDGLLVSRLEETTPKFLVVITHCVVMHVIHNQSQVSWTGGLAGMAWQICLEAIALRLEAIATRLECAAKGRVRCPCR